MLVDESLNDLQVTKGTFTGERSVTSLIHCNCGYEKALERKQSLHGSAHTFWVALLFLSKIFDSLQMFIFIGQRKWGLTSHVRCTYINVCTEWAANDTKCTINCLLLGSQWCSFTRYLTVSKWPLAQAIDNGVSPVLLTMVSACRWVHWVMLQLIYRTMLTFRITMMLVHKVLDCFQVAIGTG